MSNGEFLIVWNIVRNGSFWGNVVFWLMSKKKKKLKSFCLGEENYFSMYNVLMRLSWKHCSVIFTFFIKNLSTKSWNFYS